MVFIIRVGMVVPQTLTPKILHALSGESILSVSDAWMVEALPYVRLEYISWPAPFE